MKLFSALLFALLTLLGFIGCGRGRVLPDTQEHLASSGLASSASDVNYPVVLNKIIDDEGWVYEVYQELTEDSIFYRLTDAESGIVIEEWREARIARADIEKQEYEAVALGRQVWSDLYVFFYIEE